MSYENRRLLDCAHAIHECTLLLPGVCKGYEVEGCEPAHANQAARGKGGAMKADDFAFAAACHPCHVELDQGRRFSREEKVDLWTAGYWRTVAILWSRRLVKVA